MAGPMGMVKLFVRSGVQVVSDVYQAYQNLMQKLGQTPRIAVAIVHHANYKINKLKEKQLAGLGIKFPMPWLLSEFGNVSAASNMIAFLRQLPKLKPGDHVLDRWLWRWHLLRRAGGGDGRLTPRAHQSEFRTAAERGRRLLFDSRIGHVRLEPASSASTHGSNVRVRDCAALRRISRPYTVLQHEHAVRGGRRPWGSIFAVCRTSAFMIAAMAAASILHSSG